MSTMIFLVEGMTCKNCKAHVENGIKTIPGIEEAVADFQTGVVKVKGSDIDANKIKTVVEKAGYRFKGPEKANNPGSDMWLS